MRLRIVDVGNVDTKELTLAEVHDAETEAVAEIVARGGLPVVLGGGHDLTYPGVRGLVTGANIGRGGMGLINVDAHLDVRSDENGINSGTSFYRALTQLPGGALSGEAFVEFGIQEQYNSPYYYNWVLEQGGRVVTLREVSERVMEFFLQALNAAGKNGRAIAVSLDIDAVRSTEAPGASASNPSGLKAPELDKIAYLAGRSVKVKYLDIMEVSPPLDEDHRTAALAASALFSSSEGSARDSARKFLHNEGPELVRNAPALFCAMRQYFRFFISTPRRRPRAHSRRRNGAKRAPFPPSRESMRRAGNRPCRACIRPLRRPRRTSP